MVDVTGFRNLMGAFNPAIEAMIGRMLNSEDQDDYVAAVRALDRVLTAQHYVVPCWYNPVSRIAQDVAHRFPETIPIYGDFIGWHPDVWWVAD